MRMDHSFDRKGLRRLIQNTRFCRDPLIRTEMGLQLADRQHQGQARIGFGFQTGPTLPIRSAP